ncbi:phospholipase D family protein [Georgfuchsia toluolica]|uniref:phospholipase D family protein n=1 Tax=Georgfuchsia toluolica TaxID=424218 RepID=UPI001C73CE9C|nr:phospholipase D family protein [Georgfuchsia toluolica]
MAVLIVAFVGGCASLPPGSDFPKTISTAYAYPEQTRLGRQFADAAIKHDGNSGFRIISVGADGFLTRMQMINAAERTLDLQYFIFRGDETGKLLTDAVLRAADRGVRVRVLIDDGETVAGDDQISALAAHPSIEIRIFNPFAYRGSSMLFRAIEFMINNSRLDYRMHNKLLVIDNTVALVGGRNIGDQYFQIDPDSQFADDDVFAAGPVAQGLSRTFDEYWNSALSIPAEALSGKKTSHAALNDHREVLSDQGQQLKKDGVDYAKRVANGEPLNGMISGRLPLVWAHAQLVCDSPDKKKVENGAMVGRLMHRAVADATGAVQSELLMVTPYLIPGKEGMQLFKGLRQRQVRVRILTSSLESSTVLPSQAGYMHYRVPLLEEGVELYEIRSLLGNARGSGQTASMSRYGNYSLHAKLFVFDRKKLFIGSMNFDQRSMHLNTEIGLIIDSPELAQQVTARFDAMVQPANSYMLALRPNGSGGRSSLVWRTQEDGKVVEYDIEPARSNWQRFNVNILSLLPMDKEL